MRWKGCRVNVQSNLCCSEHYISNATSLKHSFSGVRIFPKSQTKTIGEISSLDDFMSLVHYLGVRSVGRVHNEHNLHCQYAMQHHSCPSYHQWHQPDLLHYMPRPLLHTYCADPERRCTLCCQMMRGRAGTVNSVIWMWSRLILTNMHLGSLRSQM